MKQTLQPNRPRGLTDLTTINFFLAMARSDNPYEPIMITLSNASSEQVITKDPDIITFSEIFSGFIQRCIFRVRRCHPMYVSTPKRSGPHRVYIRDYSVCGFRDHDVREVQFPTTRSHQHKVIQLVQNAKKKNNGQVVILFKDSETLKSWNDVDKSRHFESYF